ncbi:CapA family protein [Microvirga alba]|uniref:CapA family protein n=1 Tax=Microvirga alba TaxID=2791025 RepID=A0A931BSN0_9HYPH|nr:CapA family protein [Microvirga alba]MBF9233928.1 CapA family protein [Microvirga alba]
MSKLITIDLCGDVMLGRGIDQVLPYPSNPQLQEAYATSARDYVALAARVNGPIPAPVELSYPWGFALKEWRHAPPSARLINLETSITRSDTYVPKGINYRMSPENAACLVSAGIDCCALANNHVLDWGISGLLETLHVLRRLGVKTAGAGRNAMEASAPAIIDVAGRGRVLVFSFAHGTSGTPRSWAATAERPGVNLLPDLSEGTAARIAEHIVSSSQEGDIVIASIHWGPNWGYEIPNERRSFAHALIELAGATIVHGHSSHHPLAIEIHRNRLILYGCGDFLNDYEGISGFEEYRGDLTLMYRASIDPDEETLAGLRLVPLQIRNFRLHRASDQDTKWLRDVLARESDRFRTRITCDSDNTLMVFHDAP